MHDQGSALVLVAVTPGWLVPKAVHRNALRFLRAAGTTAGRYVSVVPGAWPPNFANRTMWTRDNLEVLRGLNSESVDLVYADPPFNSNKNYAAPVGGDKTIAKFKDTWTLDDVDLSWHGEIAEREPGVYAAIEVAGILHGTGMRSYLTMMAMRLLELRRVLKSTGSFWLHCDPTANAYLRLLLDGIFGSHRIRNEIVWCYTGPAGARSRQFNRKHDTLFWVSKGDSWTFNADAVRVPHKKPIGAGGTSTKWLNGGDDDLAARYATGKVPETWWSRFSPVGRLKNERVGYPTQKPLALLDRIIKASSNPGDVVLDPFCGCATACVSAETLGRQWLGIDLSPVAGMLVEQRLRESFNVAYPAHEIHHRNDIPQRTDLGHLPKYGTHKQRLYGEQDACCAGCTIRFPIRNFEVDHKIPRAKGGTDHFENLQLLCGACNRAKGIGTHDELIAKLKERGQLREAA